MTEKISKKKIENIKCRVCDWEGTSDELAVTKKRSLTNAHVQVRKCPECGAFFGVDE